MAHVLRRVVIEHDLWSMQHVLWSIEHVLCTTNHVVWLAHRYSDSGALVWGLQLCVSRGVGCMHAPRWFTLKTKTTESSSDRQHSPCSNISHARLISQPFFLKIE